MTEKEKNALALKILSMPPEEWAELRKKIKRVATLADRIRKGESNWATLRKGVWQKNWSKKILFAAGFQVFENDVLVLSANDFKNKKTTIFPPEDES